jgi:hypothetical protein
VLRFLIAPTPCHRRNVTSFSCHLPEKGANNRPVTGIARSERGGQPANFIGLGSEVWVYWLSQKSDSYRNNNSNDRVIDPA